MKILILGKNGQVGWELQRSLAPLGEIVALGRDSIDLERPDLIRGIVEGIAPDIIVNASAYTAVDKAESEPGRADLINHLAVKKLAQVAAFSGAWMIHYSTDYVFDGSKSTPYLESDPTNPINVYGKTKRDGEVALTRSGAKHLIFRTSWVHAARGQNFIRTIFRLARERDTLSVVADQFGSPTSAELIADVTAHALAGILRHEDLKPGIYNLVAGGETSWHEFAQFIVREATAMGAELRSRADSIAPIAAASYMTAAKRPMNSQLDNGKLRSALRILLPDWRYHAKRSIRELLQASEGAAEQAPPLR